MKKYIYYIGCLLLSGFLNSCDDFLTKEPLDRQTNDSYWQSETSLRTYAQDFYSHFFPGYAQDYRSFGGYFSGDDFTDDFLTLQGGYFYFPTSATTDSNAGSANWDDGYEMVYKANVMLEKIPGMDISDEAKNHWLGIAHFFRAMAYSKLAKLYGGVPYIDHVIDPSNKEELYKDRESLPFIAKKILEDYNFALVNVRTTDSKLQVDRYVVGSFMSRDLLYFATWLKYHGSTVGSSSQPVSNDELLPLFKGALVGATEVMNSGKFAIGNTYNALFSSESLYNNPEIIFYREYAEGVACNALMSYNSGEEQVQGSLTQNIIESYLCSDGLPVQQSPLYKGKDDARVEYSLQDRDPRLYETIQDTLRITGAGLFSIGAAPTGYATKKFLNEEWYKNDSPYTKNIQSPADAPCIRYAEVLLNYVEAKYEASLIGGDAFTQEDLDKTINQLRKRKIVKWGETEARTMPTVTLAGNSLSVNGVIIDDPSRDTDVSPILWEIRRERRIELVMEGRRGEDLRRWAKYEYLNSENNDGTPSKTILGAFIKTADYPGIITGDKGVHLFNPKAPGEKNPTEGYIWYLNQDHLRTFKKGDINSERYYLRAIPSTQIILYKDNGYTLTQNPGW